MSLETFRPPIHATNAWNPLGQDAAPIARTRLYFAHGETLAGARTFVLLGDQKHLTFIADLEGHIAEQTIRDRVVAELGLYPHLVDMDPEPGLPRLSHTAAVEAE